MSRATNPPNFLAEIVGRERLRVEAARRVVPDEEMRRLAFAARRESVGRALGTERAWVVHGLDGLDEVTITTKTRVAEASAGRVETFEIGPEDFGLERDSLDGARARDAEASAATVRAILEGRGRGAARSLVVANAAAALFVGGHAGDLRGAARLAEASIDNGAARAKLEELARATNG